MAYGMRHGVSSAILHNTILHAALPHLPSTMPGRRRQMEVSLSGRRENAYQRQRHVHAAPARARTLSPLSTIRRRHLVFFECSMGDMPCDATAWRASVERATPATARRRLSGGVIFSDEYVHGTLEHGRMGRRAWCLDVSGTAWLE